MSTVLKLAALLASLAPASAMPLLLWATLANNGAQYVELKDGEASCEAAGYDHVINLNECHVASKQLYKDKSYVTGDLDGSGEHRWYGSRAYDVSWGQPSGCTVQIANWDGESAVLAQRNRQSSAAPCGNIAWERQYNCICKVVAQVTETSFPLFTDEDIQNSATPAALYVTGKPNGKITDFLASYDYDYTCSAGEEYKMVYEGYNCYMFGLEDICDENECKFAITQASDPSEGTAECAEDMYSATWNQMHPYPMGCGRTCSNGYNSAVCQNLPFDPNGGPNGGYTNVHAPEAGPGLKKWSAYVNTYGSESGTNNPKDGTSNPTGDQYFNSWRALNGVGWEGGNTNWHYTLAHVCKCPGPDGPNEPHLCRWPVPSEFSYSGDGCPGASSVTVDACVGDLTDQAQLIQSKETELAAKKAEVAQLELEIDGLKDQQQADSCTCHPCASISCAEVTCDDNTPELTQQCCCVEDEAQCGGGSLQIGDWSPPESCSANDAANNNAKCKSDTHTCQCSPSGCTCEEGEDSTPPVITLIGDATVTVEKGEPYADDGATADGGEQVTTSTTCASVGNEIDTSVVGTCTITYTAIDASGNDATPVTRTVEVVDTTPPEITRNGDATITISVGDTYADPGATTTEGTVVATITTTEGDPVAKVDTSVAGTYAITYTSVDEHGNDATPVTRTVEVEEKEEEKCAGGVPDIWFEQCNDAVWPPLSTGFCCSATGNLGPGTFGQDWGGVGEWGWNDFCDPNRWVWGQDWGDFPGCDGESAHYSECGVAALDLVTMGCCPESIMEPEANWLDALDCKRVCADPPEVCTGDPAIDEVLKKSDIGCKIGIDVNSPFNWERFCWSVRTFNEMDGGRRFYLGSELQDPKDRAAAGLANIAALLANAMWETGGQSPFTACDENNYRGFGEEDGDPWQSYTPPCTQRSDLASYADLNHAENLYGCRKKIDEAQYLGMNMVAQTHKPDVEPLTCKPGSQSPVKPYPSSSDPADHNTAGCCWWGRGGLQTTGPDNYGFVQEEVVEKLELKDASGAIIDLCLDPEAMCKADTEDMASLRWLSAIFFWAQSVQGYTDPETASTFYTSLHNYIASGLTMLPEQGVVVASWGEHCDWASGCTSDPNDPSFVAGANFFDGASGMVNNGAWHKGSHGFRERRQLFERTMGIFLENGMETSQSDSVVSVTFTIEYQAASLPDEAAGAAMAADLAGISNGELQQSNIALASNILVYTASSDDFAYEALLAEVQAVACAGVVVGDGCTVTAVAPPEDVDPYGGHRQLSKSVPAARHKRRLQDADQLTGTTFKVVQVLLEDTTPAGALASLTAAFEAVGIEMSVISTRLAVSYSALVAGTSPVEAQAQESARLNTYYVSTLAAAFGVDPSALRGVAVKTGAAPRHLPPSPPAAPAPPPRIGFCSNGVGFPATPDEVYPCYACYDDGANNGCPPGTICQVEEWCTQATKCGDEAPWPNPSRCQATEYVAPADEDPPAGPCDAMDCEQVTCTTSNTELLAEYESCNAEDYPVNLDTHVGRPCQAGLDCVCNGPWWCSCSSSERRKLLFASMPHVKAPDAGSQFVEVESLGGDLAQQCCC